MRSAILFLVFNRPDTTREVLDAIRAARPPRLYVAADGPRADRPGEAQRCAEVRRIAKNVDWPCEVQTLFRDQNLGCNRGCASGISWFFENEEEGIILEDDVVPLPSFFPYCDELLERYRDDERVAMISGCNTISRRFASKESYFFSRYSLFWGWASWRRAWGRHDVAMKGWPAWRDQGGLAKLSGGNRLFEAYWRHNFDAAHSGTIDTWDHQWTFSCWKMGRLSIIPARNQTLNLGFRSDATHTTTWTPSYVSESAPEPLDFPLVHPELVTINSAADAILDEYVYKINHLKILRQKILSYRIANRLLRAVRKWVISWSETI
ncbi:MAG TPA: glycosyltransferase family 2 protein [Burkholderiales bacterium]|nr:glycosyltransferase family 2 protein [Burkholderiales bacterium]